MERSDSAGSLESAWAVSPDGAALCLSDTSHLLSVFDIAVLRVNPLSPSQCEAQLDAFMMGATFSDDGARLLTMCASARVEVRDARSEGLPVLRTLDLHGPVFDHGYKEYIQSRLCCTGDLAVAFGMSSYLLVISQTGFYTIYLQVNLAGGSTQVVNAQMVAALATDQDRVVLSWGSSDDLDLWIVAKDSTQAYAVPSRLLMPFCTCRM